MQEAIEKVNNWTSGSILDLSNLHLAKLPNLPAGVEHLDITGNFITKIHSLPNSIKELHCDFNSISYIENLPKNLVHFSCNFNAIGNDSNLNFAMRKLNKLKYLSMITNNIVNLSNIPDSVETLKVSFNPLSSVKRLPKFLKNFEGAHCEITSLPKKLPQKLEFLNVECNHLKTLPDIPDTVTNLNCSTNQIRLLPKLSSNLKILYADNNILEEFPELPVSLEKLNISNNNITSIVNLPSNLGVLDFTGNPIFGDVQIPDTIFELNGIDVEHLEDTENFKPLPFEDFYTIKEVDNSFPVNLLTTAFDFINFEDVNIVEFLHKNSLNIIIKCGSQLYAYNREFLMGWFKDTKNRYIYREEDYFRTPLNHTIQLSDVIKFNFLDYKFFDFSDTIHTIVKNGSVIRVSKVESKFISEI